MVPEPEYHVRGEIRKILDPVLSRPELLLRIRGRSYSPERTSTFVDLRVIDATGRIGSQRLTAGAEVTGLLRMTARFVEPCERPARTLEVNGRPKSGRPPRAIRLVGYDARIAGEVLRHLEGDSFLLDAGLPVLVEAPGVRVEDYPVGRFVEFLLHDPPELVA